MTATFRNKPTFFPYCISLNYVQACSIIAMYTGLKTRDTTTTMTGYTNEIFAVLRTQINYRVLHTCTLRGLIFAWINLCEAKIGSRGYHVFRNKTWKNAKAGEKVRVEIERNKSSKAIDPYSCAIKIKHRHFDTWLTTTSKTNKNNQYSTLSITRTVKGPRKKFELSRVRVFEKWV